MGDTVEISSAILLRIMRLSWASTLCADGKFRKLEHCGILRGRDRRITTIAPAKNVAEDGEVAFEIDPATLVGAYRAERRKGGLQVLGFYHTHPNGSPDPSPRDAECAAPDGKLWLIVSPMQARLWRAVPSGAIHGRFDPVGFDMKVGSTIRPGLMEVRHVDYGREYDVRIEGFPR